MGIKAKNYKLLQYPLNIMHEPHVHIRAKKYHLPKTDNTKSEIADGELLGDVYFYIPASLTNGAGTNWAAEDINSLAQEITAGSSDAKEGSVWSAISKYAGVGGKFLLDMTKNMAPGITSNLEKTTAGLSGHLLKPNSVLVLNNITRFFLNLNLEFSPQTPEEGEMVNRLLKTWKSWSLPTMEVDSARMWLDYPPIFDINISTKMAGVTSVSSKSFSPTNNMFAYENMVLENFSVTTNGGANESLFYEDGTPITCSVNLTFKALKPGWNSSGDSEGK